MPAAPEFLSHAETLKSLFEILTSASDFCEMCYIYLHFKEYHADVGSVSTDTKHEI